MEEILKKEIVAAKLLKCINSVLKEYNNSESVQSIQNETNIIEEFGFDSLALISLIMEIESEFNIEFLDDDLDFEKWSKYENIINEIISKIEL